MYTDAGSKADSVPNLGTGKNSSLSSSKPLPAFEPDVATLSLHLIPGQDPSRNPHLRRRLLDSLNRLLGLALHNILGILRLNGQLLAAAHVVVVDEAEHLGELRAAVDHVAGEEEVVGGSDGQAIASEGDGVDAQGTGHGSGNPVIGKGQYTEISGDGPLRRTWSGVGFVDAQFGTLEGVHDSGNGDTEVGDGTPEV